MRSRKNILFNLTIILLLACTACDRSTRHRELVASGGTYMDCPRFGIAYTGIHSYLPALNRKRAGGLCFAAFVSPISLLHPCIFGFVND